MLALKPRPRPNISGYNSEVISKLVGLVIEKLSWHNGVQVWLIEVNANPCLATNCQVLKAVVPSVVQEALCKLACDFHYYTYTSSQLQYAAVMYGQWF